MTIQDETPLTASITPSNRSPAQGDREPNLIDLQQPSSLHVIREEVSMGQMKIISAETLGSEDNVDRIIPGTPHRSFRHGSKPVSVVWSCRVGLVRSGSPVEGCSPTHLQSREHGINLVELCGIMDPVTETIHLPEARIRVTSDADGNVQLGEIIHWISVKDPPKSFRPKAVQLYYEVHGIRHRTV